MPVNGTRPEGAADRVTVGVLTLDQLLGDLLMVGINSAPSLVAAPALAADPDVLLIASNPLDEQGQRSLGALIDERCADRSRPAVLVIGKVTDQQATYALGRGLSDFVSWSESSVQHLVGAIHAASYGYRWESALALISVLQHIHDLREVTSPRDALSPREAAILGLLADGLGTREVAGRSNYSERTVKTIITGMQARYDLANRSQLVAFAYRNGLL